MEDEEQHSAHAAAYQAGDAQVYVDSLFAMFSMIPVVRFDCSVAVDGPQRARAI